MSARVVFGRKFECKKCGELLRFYRNERGNAVPCNPDGSDHWDRCRDVRYKRAIASSGGVLTRRDRKGGGWEEGYLNNETGEFFKVKESAGVITGGNFNGSAG